MYLALSVLLTVGALGHGGSAQLSEISLDPLLGLVTCLREPKPGYCMRERALGYFETWLTGEEDDNPASPAADDEAPAESETKLSPYWHKMVNNVAERIAGIYEEEQDAKNRRSGDNSTAEQRTVEDLARGHHKKKKKIKAIKKALIKLVLIALLIKHKLKMLLTAFQTFLQFKAVLLATILVIIHVIKLWAEIKHKHHPQKVIYYENAHHQHHYDHHDEHGDHWEESGGGGGGGGGFGSGWGLWGRSDSSSPSTTTPIYAPYLARSAAAHLAGGSHLLAYRGQMPGKLEPIAPQSAPPLASQS